MKLFSIKILAFCVAFFLFDKLFILIREYSPTLEVDKRLEELINGEINEEIIILGSSKGARDILASEIEQDLGFSTYNLSYPGSGVEFHEFLLRKLLENNTPPQVVILTIDEEVEFKENRSIKFRLDRMYPLVAYPQIRDELYNRGEKSKLLSNLFILHQLSVYNFDLRPKKFTKLDRLQEDGSMPIEGFEKGLEWHYKTEKESYDKKVESQSKLRSFEDIKEMCANNNIKLVFSFPPTYSPLNGEFLNRFKEISEDYPIHLYDENKFKEKKLFHDLTHLNRNGAKVYTSDLISFLKTNI